MSNLNLPFLQKIFKTKDWSALPIYFDFLEDQDNSQLAYHSEKLRKFPSLRGFLELFIKFGTEYHRRQVGKRLYYAKTFDNRVWNFTPESIDKPTCNRWKQSKSFIRRLIYDKNKAAATFFFLTNTLKDIEGV